MARSLRAASNWVCRMLRWPGFGTFPDAKTSSIACISYSTRSSITLIWARRAPPKSGVRLCGNWAYYFLRGDFYFFFFTSTSLVGELCCSSKSSFRKHWLISSFSFAFRSSTSVLLIVLQFSLKSVFPCRSILWKILWCFCSSNGVGRWDG